MGNVTAKDALFIAKKLKATIITRRKAHDLAVVTHDGDVIARFGIRRGSGEHGHGHIPALLHLGPHETKRLADCSLSRDEWIKILKDKGVV